MSAQGTGRRVERVRGPVVRVVAIAGDLVRPEVDPVRVENRVQEGRIVSNGRCRGHFRLTVAVVVPAHGTQVVGLAKWLRVSLIVDISAALQKGKRHAQLAVVAAGVDKPQSWLRTKLTQNRTDRYGVI